MACWLVTVEALRSLRLGSRSVLRLLLFEPRSDTPCCSTDAQVQRGVSAETACLGTSHPAIHRVLSWGGGAQGWIITVRVGLSREGKHL